MNRKRAFAYQWETMSSIANTKHYNCYVMNDIVQWKYWNQFNESEMIHYRKNHESVCTF